MWPALVFAFLLLVQQNPTGGTAPDHTAAGMKALEEQKYEEAREAFQKAVEADAEDYGALFHLALANSLLNKDEEAIGQYRKVLELKPGLYQAQLNLGVLLVRQKQATEAVTLLEAAAAQRPKEFRPLYYLAEALRAAREFARAEAQYKAALDVDGSSAPALAGLGQAVAAQGRLDEAGGFLKRAGELDTSYKGALLELGPMYEAKGQRAEAIAIYRQFPENPGARERLAELLLDAGEVQQAIKDLEEATKISPTSANRAALAMAYIKNKEPEKGLALLAQAVAADGSNIELRLVFGRALRDAKQYVPAAKEFLRVAEAKPDSREAWGELASALVLAENYPLAISALDRLAALGEETPGQMYLRAIILDRLKQYKPALESYQKFLAAGEGKFPDEEFKARQRVRIIQKELNRR